MIAKGKVVSLAYILKNAEGEILDEGGAENPFAYMHGMSQIVPGLENALVGLKTGDKKSVTVEPKEGYGDFDQALLAQVSRGQFPPQVKLEEGMQFEGGEEGRQMVFTIDKIEGDTVFINGNHPLAGQKLFFDVEVLDIRDATKEEIAHGHVHGPGGHHH